MEISQDKLRALLTKVAAEAVEAAYATIAERERIARKEAAALEAEQAAARIEAERTAAEALEAAKVAEGVSWAYGLFGALAAAIEAADRLEREAFETRQIKVAMFDASGAYLGMKEGRADLIDAADVSALPDWAKPPAITYVEWSEEFDALHAQALAQAGSTPA